MMGNHEVVAKIYLSKKDAKAREEKIREMSCICRTAAFQQKKILDDIAWPLAPLFNGNREFIGFGMRRITANYELDDIYSQSRKTGAGMDMSEKIRVLISLCTVVEKLHSCGQVFGDFNPNNIKIDQNCKVKFVDCDSYHFHTGKKVYPCVVCAPGYAAPELIKNCKGTTYADCFANGGSTFTRETDLFALAIHCFRMLMNGCHPYTCKKHVKNVGSTPAPSVDKRIEKGETPFFVKVPNFTTPDWAPDVSCLPEYLRRLFQKAFVEGHANPSARPDAAQWRPALETYQKEIKKCSKKPEHYYWNRLKVCPYCLAEERKQKNLSVAMRGTTQPQIQRKAGNTCVGTVPVNNNQSNKNICSARTVPQNSTVYWITTGILGTFLQVLLDVYGYEPFYRSFTEKGWAVWLGAAFCLMAAVVGILLYGTAWSGASQNGSRYRWYDYLLAQLTGVGFAVATAIVLVILAYLLHIIWKAVAGVLWNIMKVVLIIILIGSFLSGMSE